MIYDFTVLNKIKELTCFLWTNLSRRDNPHRGQSTLVGTFLFFFFSARGDPGTVKFKSSHSLWWKLTPSQTTKTNGLWASGPAGPHLHYLSLRAQHHQHHQQVFNSEVVDRILSVVAKSVTFGSKLRYNSRWNDNRIRYLIR